jgi:hypothetical protein
LLPCTLAALIQDFTVKTVQKAADIAVKAGSRLYTDSASSYRLITGYEHDSVVAYLVLLCQILSEHSCLNCSVVIHHTTAW